MQPHVVAVHRQHPEERVHSRNQAHHGEHAVEEGERARENLRACPAAPGHQAPDADGNVHGAVQDVHGEESQEVAVHEGKGGRRRIGRRRHQRGRNEAEQPRAEVGDAEDQCERCAVHVASCWYSCESCSAPPSRIATRQRRLAFATRTAWRIALHFVGKYAMATRVGPRSLTLQTPSRVWLTESSGVPDSSTSYPFLAASTRNWFFTDFTPSTCFAICSAFFLASADSTRPFSVTTPSLLSTSILPSVLKPASLASALFTLVVRAALEAPLLTFSRFWARSSAVGSFGSALVSLFCCANAGKAKAAATATAITAFISRLLSRKKNFKCRLMALRRGSLRASPPAGAGSPA